MFGCEMFGKTNQRYSFDRTVWRLWVPLHPSLKRRDFRMLVGQFEPLSQMLTLHLRGKSSNNLTQPTDQQCFVQCYINYNFRLGAERLRSQACCWCCCLRRKPWPLFCTAVMIGCCFICSVKVWKNRPWFGKYKSLFFTAWYSHSVWK